jgi:hypothetical protein
MDPFTIALATFGVQKLRGKSTKRSLRDALLAGGIGYGIGQMGGAGLGIGQGAPFSSLGITAFAPETAVAVTTASTVAPIGSSVGVQEAGSLLGNIPVEGEPYLNLYSNTTKYFLGKAGALYGKLGTAEKIGLGVTGALY